ncbi:unnamed protein product [Urochloa humidicola]
MHNVKMFKEITLFRSSVMRLNAMLLDWLVSNVDPIRLQMIHKKLVLSPSVPINVVMRENIRAPSGIVLPVSQQTCSIDGPKSVAVKPQCNEMEKLCVDVEPTSYVLGFDNSPIGSSFVSRGPLVDPMEVTNFESIKRAADDDHGSHVKQQHLEINGSHRTSVDIGNSTMKEWFDIGSYQSYTFAVVFVAWPHADFFSNFLSKLPSFDLGIVTSPAGDSFVTPKSQNVK